jgi:PAS domain-containing protein
VGPERCILHWSRAAEVIFGFFSHAEALGESIDLISAPDHPDDSSDDQSVFESIRRRKRGSLLHVGVSSKALRDADGRIRYR